MAKTASKTAAKKPAAPKTKIAFGKWVKEVARARGELIGVIRDIRQDDGIKLNTSLDKAAAVWGKDGKWPVIVARYNGYLKRGSQAA
jgi:hypothetical protein